LARKRFIVNTERTNQTILPDDLLPVVPVRNVVVFPGAVTHISIGREMSTAAAELAVRQERKLGMLLQRDPAVDTPGPDDLYRVGTIVSVVRLVTARNGTRHLICQGEQRFRTAGFVEGLPCLVARYDVISDSERSDAEIQARANLLKEQTTELAELLPEAPVEFTAALAAIEQPGSLADFVAGFIDMSAADRQALLETFDVRERLDRVLLAVEEQLQVLQISHEIGAKSKEKLDEQQREYLLREQLKTIQQELGDEDGSELDDIEAAIAKAQMPEDVAKEARKELKRLRGMPESAAEHSMVRTYLDWLTTLPWSVTEGDAVDIARARQILDEDHYGLKKIKRRILEYLAVRKLNPQGRSPILCFVGPPGVGKTSLGQSIARALGLQFVRASLGGVHDEAEIRGHRRTYIGSMPGSIIQHIRKAGTRNPVFMLDEMDKLGAGFHGDPSSALLEVLDPEQNSTFADNYLGMPFDLSKVLFIGTANVIDNVPGPLRDRMEVIEVPGYTQEEKLEIAERYLIKRQLEANGLRAEQASIERQALAELIDGYTREAGVRNLEREIGALFRHAAMRVAEGETVAVQISIDDVVAIIGARRFEREAQMRTSLPGVATGLAWTPVGGDILFVETTGVPGVGKLILTGQLGEVMKESAQAAVSLAKTRLDKLHIDRDWLANNDVHVHVPAGAIPKDGPSAGIAMFVSVMSLLSDRKVRGDVAMTGEISLRGLVLPVGGIKEKALAALRAGITTVLLPARNRKDLEDIPESARAQLEFVWLETVEDALAVAFEPDDTAQAA
jgi:ATP-dependent Lon protease